MKTLLSGITISIVCWLAFCLAACSGKQGADPVFEKNIDPLACVVVLPTKTPVATTQNIAYGDAEQLQKGATYLDLLIGEELNNSQVPRIISAAQVEGLPTEVTGGNLGMLKRVGQELNCNAVMVSSIQRFRQRNGGEYAVDSPASAAFEMRIVDVTNGSVIWSTNFSETQQSLLSNLFSFNKAQSRGFKWITVEELMRQGVHEKISASPYLF